MPLSAPTRPCSLLPSPGCPLLLLSLLFLLQLCPLPLASLSSSSSSLNSSLETPARLIRSKRQFGFGGCCPFGGIGPVNFPMCCSAAPIGISPCCAHQLLPVLPPPMPFLPPPLPLPLIGAGCCPCCMPMCVPICIRSSCGMFGGGGCPFGGGWKQKKARQKRDMNRSGGTVISREMKDEMVNV
ncbi:hypothetical protein niasHS_017610 [Heterodera schachtii]|uniref:Uncharacterized protein n=1 Tax=Heterodera schachtii TaxID=97005 RepID=A0ABD2I060_HETSC